MENFDTKVLPKIGPLEDGGEIGCGEHLHRIIKWCDGHDAGYTWEADPKYAKNFIEAMKLKAARV